MTELLTRAAAADHLSLLAGLNAGLLGVVITIVSILPVLRSVVDPREPEAGAREVMNYRFWREVGSLWLSVLLHTVGTVASISGLLSFPRTFAAIAWLCTILGLASLSRLGVFLTRQAVRGFES